MATLRVIKEPIHNYIHISNLESELINDALFQRLHHISQNGTAYLTYPSNRTSRFVHSLGAMHLGGLMVRGALFNSDIAVRSAILTAFESVMKAAEVEINFRVHQVHASVKEDNDLCYRNYGFDPDSDDDASLAAIVMFQAVRIACVLHDVGHLPFSHTTETVLKSKIDAYVPSDSHDEYRNFVNIMTNLREGEPGHLHEMMGTVLTDYVFSETGGSRAQYGRFCFWIASRIANPESATSDPNGVIKCLSTIVSRNGYDADRGDYVLRDGYASSFEFGEYDLARILDNLRFSQQPSGELELVATTTATSALESYFLERYRIWRWMVFHHSVTQGHLALSRGLAILMELVFVSKPKSHQEQAVKRILQEWDFSGLWNCFLSSDRYRQYVRFDEHWLLSLLRKIQMSPEMTLSGPRKMAMLKVYLDFLLDRKKSVFKTMWKRAEEYEQFAAFVFKSFESMYSHLTEARKQRLKQTRKGSKESATEWFNRVIVPFLKKNLRIGEIEAMRELEDKLQESLSSRTSFRGSLLLSVLSIKMKIDCPIIDKEGNRLELQQLSTVVSDLPVTWSKDIQIRAYWVGLKRQGGGFIRDDKAVAPGVKEFAGCFLEAILGGGDWSALQNLITP